MEITEREIEAVKQGLKLAQEIANADLEEVSRMARESVYSYSELEAVYKNLGLRGMHQVVAYARGYGISLSEAHKLHREISDRHSRGVWDWP